MFESQQGEMQKAGQAESLSKEKNRLYPEEKIKNYPLYFYRIFAKLLSLAIFGLGNVVFSIIIFPFGKLIFWNKGTFRRYMRYFAHSFLKFLVKFMSFVGVIKIKVDKKDNLKNLRSAIIVANHSAYLDPVILFSQIKHIDTVAKAALSKKNIMQSVVKELFITADMPLEEMFERAKEDFADGANIVIFPEGTRSTPYGQNPYKKGAARISIATGAPVIPVYIGGNEKRGMGKEDKILQFNPTRRYHYDLYVKAPIYPDEFKDLPNAIAAKKMTEKIREVLSDDANAQYRY